MTVIIVRSTDVDDRPDADGHVDLADRTIAMAYLGDEERATPYFPS
jgi:hypothetical protein